MDVDGTGAHGCTRSRGSRHVAQPIAPTGSAPSTVIISAAPGMAMIHGASEMYCRPSAMMLPQVGVGGTSADAQERQCRLGQHGDREQERQFVRSAGAMALGQDVAGVGCGHAPRRRRWRPAHTPISRKHQHRSRGRCERCAGV